MSSRQGLLPQYVLHRQSEITAAEEPWYRNKRLLKVFEHNVYSFCWFTSGAYTAVYGCIACTAAETRRPVCRQCSCSMQGKTWKQTCPDSLQQGALSCKTYRCRKQPVELLGFSLSRSPALQKKTALFLIKTCRPHGRKDGSFLYRTALIIAHL